jgi:dinuclear metal center YbgI/SA1388 family protein
MNKYELIQYLNNYLKINEFTDKSKNWLQVDNSILDIKKIGYSVDASTYIFDRAKKENIDLIICHHGLYWWFEEALIWIPYKRAKTLIDNDIALYASHLPLDAHNEVGNNIWLLKWFVNIFWLIEWEYNIEPFWRYNENNIWYSLNFNNKIHISSLQTMYADTLKLQKKLYNFANKDFINNIAFVSWWAWDIIIKEAFSKSIDLFLTWETKHSDLVLAKELWQSIMLCWHYETEKIWPKLLSYHLKDKFWFEVIFLDEKY